MAITTLRYLQDDDDPLNDLLGGGGEPNASSAPAPSYDQTPPEPDHSLDESLLQGAPPEAPPPAAPQQARQPVSEQAPPRASFGMQKDPELDAAYRQAQLDALKHGGFDDNKYGVGEALRDNGAALIASILDIGFNKGRGLGGIVGATANEVGRQEAQRANERKDARDFALKARNNNSTALQQARLQYLMDSLAERANAHGQTQQRFDAHRGDVNNLGSEHNQTAIALAGLRAGAAKAGSLNAAHSLVDQTAGDRATIVGSEQDARAAATHDWAPVVNQDAANKAGAERRATIQTDLDYAPQTTAVAANKAEAVGAAGVAGERAGQAANRPVPPGFEKADEATFDNVNADASARQKMLGDTMAARQLSDASQSLAAMRQKYGPQMLPSQASGQYQALHLAVVGAANRAIADAGTLNAGERQLIEQYVPGATPNWKDLVGWLQGSDLNGEQLEGFAAGLQQILNSRVASYGLRKSTGAPQPTAASGAPAAPPQSAAMPGYSTDYSDPRTSLGAPQAVPPKPSAEGRKMRTIMNVKTGKTSPTMMTDAELAPVISAGIYRLVP